MARCVGQGRREQFISTVVFARAWRGCLPLRQREQLIFKLQRGTAGEAQVHVRRGAGSDFTHRAEQAGIDDPQLLELSSGNHYQAVHCVLLRWCYNTQYVLMVEGCWLNIVNKKKVC